MFLPISPALFIYFPTNNQAVSHPVVKNAEDICELSIKLTIAIAIYGDVMYN